VFVPVDLISLLNRQLPKQHGLPGSVVRLLKVAQTNTNESTTLFLTKINPVAQLQGDLRQFFGGRRRTSCRMAASENLELAGLQLEDNRACRS
jgi:hypothetical protein